MLPPHLCPKAQRVEAILNHPERFCWLQRPREYKPLAHSLTANQLQALQDGCGSLTTDPLAAPILPPLSASPVPSWSLQKWNLWHLSVSYQSLEAEAMSENCSITVSGEGPKPGPPFRLHENGQGRMRALKPKFKLHLALFAFLSTSHVCFFLLY